MIARESLLILSLMGFFWSQNVGIGTAMPEARLHVFTQSTLADPNPNLVVLVECDGGSSDVVPRSFGIGRPGISCFRARGTKSSPAAVQAGDILGFIGGRGHNGTDFGTFSDGALVIYAADRFTTTSHPTYLTLETTPIGSTTRLERVRITSEGNVGIGTTTPVARLHVNGLLYAGLPTTRRIGRTSYAGGSDPDVTTTAAGVAFGTTPITLPGPGKVYVSAHVTLVSSAYTPWVGLRVRARQGATIVDSEDNTYTEVPGLDKYQTVSFSTILDLTGGGTWDIEAIIHKIGDGVTAYVWTYTISAFFLSNQ